MHEASIALSVLDIIVKKCVNEGYRIIESVRLRIGRAAGIMPEALSFAFDAVKADTPASGASLSIDIVLVGGFCDSCKSDFEVEDSYVFKCPVCGSSEFKVNKGHEMEIAEIEVK